MTTNSTLHVKQSPLVLFFMLLFLFNGGIYSQTLEEALNSQKGTEDLTKRNQFSKHFINEDGSATAIVTAGSSLNYRDLDNKWQSIDNTIIVSNSPISPEYTWENTTNRFKSYYPKEVSHGIITSYAEGTVKEGLNKRMLWLDADFNTISEYSMQNVTGYINAKTLNYSDVFRGVDLRYTQLNDGRKMDYILREASFIENLSEDIQYLAFAENIDLPTGAYLVPEKNASGISNINVMLDGELAFRYELPQHYDSNGQEIFSNYLVRGNTIYTLVEKNWLTSGLSYPVYIDPTVTVYPTGNGDYVTGCIDNEGTANKTAPADIYVGMRHAYGQTTGTRRFFRAWASFDVSTIPASILNESETTIESVTFGCYLGLNSMDTNYGQYARVGQITSGIPNQATGPTLYNMCGENPADAYFSVDPGTAGIDATLDISSVATNDIKNSLDAGIYSLGFAPVGNYDPGFTEQVAIYGSTRPEQTSQGKPYLTITYSVETLSVTDYKTDVVGIHPNPVQSNLIISSTQKVETIEVYSLLGQLVLLETNKNKINVENLSDGMYILKLSLENGTSISRRIIKN